MITAFKSRRRPLHANCKCPHCDALKYGKVYIQKEINPKATHKIVYKPRVDKPTSYDEYVVKMHPRWKRKRQEAFRRYGSECAVCLSKGQLHVHHITYKRLYNENLKDLRVLCEKCHKELHKHHDAYGKPDLAKFSIDFIKRMREVKRKERLG